VGLALRSRFHFLLHLSQFATFSRGLVAGFVALNALVLALVLLSLKQNRDDHLNGAVVVTQNLVQLLEHSAADSFQRIDRTLLAVSDRLEREIDEGGTDGQMMNDFLAREFSRQTDFDSLQVADDHGNVIYAAGGTPVARANVAESDFFIKLRDDPQAATSYSKPMPGKATDEAGIIIARRVERRKGGFAGAIYAVVGPDWFQRVFAGVDLGSNGLIAIRDLDRGLVVRRPQLPDIDSASESATVSSAFREALFANPGSGTFTSKNGSNGVERSYAYRKLSGYPYYVIVGVATDDYLLGWRHEALPALVLAASFALATFVLSDLLNRFWKRREASAAMLAKQEAKFRKLLEWAPDALVITDSQGLIVMINQRTETMFGYARDELVGQSVQILLPERYRSQHGVMVRRFAARAETRRMGVGRQLWAVTKDGREFSVNISLSPIETDEGMLITADIRDMTGLSAAR
jgi:PAS domain S-box-containing protein